MSTQSGRIQNGVAAPYDFSIGEVIKDAWHRLKGFKATFWGAIGFFVLSYLAVVLAAFGINFVLLLLGMSVETVKSIDSLLYFLVMLPLTVGLLMLGVRYIANLPVRSKQVFRYFRKFWAILGVYIAMTLIYAVVAVLAVALYAIAAAPAVATIVKVICGIAGVLVSVFLIYLILGYIFSMLLKVEKDLSIWQSLQVSRKAVTQHWFKIFFTILVMQIITVISAIPLGIGLIWTIPMGYLVLSTLYKILFGIQLKD